MRGKIRPDQNYMSSPDILSQNQHSAYLRVVAAQLPLHHIQQSDHPAPGIVTLARAAAQDYHCLVIGVPHSLHFWMPMTMMLFRLVSNYSGNKVSNYRFTHTILVENITYWQQGLSLLYVLHSLHPAASICCHV